MTEAAASSAGERSLQSAEKALHLSAATEPSGNFVTTLDASSDLGGLAVSPSALQAQVSKLQGQNGLLSDMMKRFLEQDTLGSYGPDLTNWQDFSGTLSVTSDGTGLSFTIPGAEVSTWNIPEWLGPILQAMGGFSPECWP